MIHYAGVSATDTNWFFTKVKSVDYDYIGLSYYPIWHGKDLATIKTTIDALVKNFSKKVLIAETAYPFTLGFNDWTNNIVGLDSQLVSGYPATAEGQKNFVLAIKDLVKSSRDFDAHRVFSNGNKYIVLDVDEQKNKSILTVKAVYKVYSSISDEKYKEIMKRENLELIKYDNEEIDEETYKKNFYNIIT